MKPAFVVIDMQKQFLEKPMTYVPSVAYSAELINYVASLFRKKGFPVIFVMDEESCKEGEPSFGLVDDLEVEASDEQIHKVHGNAFRDTVLLERIRELGIDFLLFAGFKAEGCVLATLHGAQDNDIPHAILREAVVSNTPDAVAFVEKTFPLMSCHVVGPLLCRD